MLYRFSENIVNFTWQNRNSIAQINMLFSRVVLIREGYHRVSGCFLRLQSDMNKNIREHIFYYFTNIAAAHLTIPLKLHDKLSMIKIFL